MLKQKMTKFQKSFFLMKIGVFMAVLILPTLVWGLLGITGKTNPESEGTLNFNLGENRLKAEFPTEFNSATFFAELEDYYDDRVPFRSVIISNKNKYTNQIEGVYKQHIQPTLIAMLYGDAGEMPSGAIVSGNLDNMFGNDETTEQGKEDMTQEEFMSEHQYVEQERKEYSCSENGYVVYLCAECGEEYVETLYSPGHNYEEVQTVEPDYDNYGYTLVQCRECNLESKQNFTEKLIDTSYLPPNVLNGSAIEGRRGWLFFTGNGSVSYYRGANLLAEETLADYATRVKTLQDLCDQKGIQLQLMIIPNKEQVYEEYMPSYTIEDEYKRVPRLVDYVKEETGIEILYPLEELKLGKLYWQVYFKRDTHWNEAGAFIGVQTIYQALGMDTTAITEVNYEKFDRPGGDLTVLGALGPENFTDDVQYSIAYKSDVNILSSSGDKTQNSTYTAETDSENKCNFVFIGDSFRNAMIPYLEKDFSNSYFTHRDYLSSDNAKKAVKEADILVMVAVERHDNRLMDSLNTAISILAEE